MFCENIEQVLRNPPFLSCRLKIARAQEHADLVYQELETYLGSNPFELFPTPRPNPLRHSVVVRINRPPDLDRWSLIAADAIHNWRSALDNLIYGIAIHESGQDPPPEGARLEFPIHETPERFAANTRIRTLTAKTLDILETLQPYNRPHGELYRPLLAILRSVNDIDKHRILQLAVPRPPGARIDIIAGAPSGLTYAPYFNGGPISDGCEVIALVLDRPAPLLQLQISATFCITIQYGSEQEKVALESLMVYLAGEIEAVVTKLCESL